MSRRLTPVEYMTGPRYAAWAEKRERELQRERGIRYLAAILIPAFVVIVALVLAALFVAWEGT